MKHIKLYESYISESGIFNTWNTMVPSDFKDFVQNYKELHKDNKVIYDKNEDVTWGFRKGNKEGHWKYDHDTYKIQHSEKDQDVLGLINFKKMVAKDHPWSK